MTTGESVNVDNAVSQVSKGKDINNSEDNWMAMWCKTNWGDLLQPAPLSIALLGSLMVISSDTRDFSLIPQNTSVKLTYTKYPTSFKTCLQQMVGDGYTAFETASHEMTRINNASSQLPDAIKRAMTILMQNTSPQEAEYLLPTALESVSELTNICVNASRTCETAFVRISSLAQEILECAKLAASEQTTDDNEMHLTILKEQAKQEKEMVDEAKQASSLMKRSFKDAEQGFKNAVDKVPSGWEMMGLNVVDNLTNAITAPVNALIGMANRVRGQSPEADKSGAAGEPTQPFGTALSDTGVFLADQIMGLVMSLNHLISGGPDGKPDWDNIRASKGGLYLKAGLERMQDRLDVTKPISKELLPLVEQAVKVAISVNATAASIEGTCDTSLDQHKPMVKKLVEDLQSIVTQCNLILRQTENTATGPGIPSTKNVWNSPSHTQAAIGIARFRVDQTRANLELAQDSYDKATARLIESQREITKTIASMTKLSLETATLKEIVPVLVQVLEAFTTLRAQFSEMMRFFCNIASLLNDVMKPQVYSWVRNIDASSKLVHAGVTLSDSTRHVMYSQMMGPLKVSMLAEQISGMYLHVSDLYIMPAQREVGHLLQLQEDTTEEGKRQFLLKLTEAQAAIQEKSHAASEKILELVAVDQQKFAGTIDQRLQMVQEAAGKVLHPIKEPVPRHISQGRPASRSSSIGKSSSLGKKKHWWDPLHV